MKACIFIDGENLRHSLCDLFKPTEFDPTDYLPKTARWEEFFDFLATRCYSSTRLRTYWYVVEAVEFWPWKLPNEDEKLLRVISKHPPYAEELKRAGQKVETARRLSTTIQDERTRFEKRFHGWHIIQNGIATQHDATEFRRAGTIRYDLFKKELGKEKAVDVMLAVDMLELSPIYEVAIILSGDGDYVPAVQAVKDKGKRVINVSFEARNGELLPGGARKLNQITDKVLVVKYEQMRDFMLQLK